MGIGVKYLPIAIIVLLVASISVTLFLTFIHGHVSDSLPYISDTGTLPPESCIFGQVLNLLWIMISYAMYIKYRQTAYLLKKYNMQENEILNRRTLDIGLLAAFGSSIVANFQETNMFFIHWFGAVLVFGVGSVYQCMQTMLYIRLMSILGQKKLTKLRMGLAAISIISFLVFFVCAMISYSQKKVSADYLHWKKYDGGYEYHNVSVVFEWICASSTMMYLSLFAEEFKRVTVQELDVFTENGETDVEHISSNRGK